MRYKLLHYKPEQKKKLRSRWYYCNKCWTLYSPEEELKERGDDNWFAYICPKCKKLMYIGSNSFESIEKAKERFHVIEIYE